MTMRHTIAPWAALLLVGALYGVTPAHAQGACDAGDTLLGSNIRHDGDKTFRDDYCAKAPGSWSRAELDHVFSVWNSMPDTPAKAWVMKNVTFMRKQDKVQPPICVIGRDGVKKCSSPLQMASPYATLYNDQAALIFNDNFFSETPAVQRSLFAFESGKALYLKLNLGSWFSLNLSAYAPAMGEMLAAGKAQGEPNDDFADASSQFGALFRVAMLQIPAAGHPGWQAPLAKLDAMLRRITPSP
jgi:hypothetical protein